MVRNQDRERWREKETRIERRRSGVSGDLLLSERALPITL